MMWHEEHLWNVSVLQRIHLSNVVSVVNSKRFDDAETIEHGAMEQPLTVQKLS
jgi:hypothetical protein